MSWLQTQLSGSPKDAAFSPSPPKVTSSPHLHLLFKSPDRALAGWAVAVQHGEPGGADPSSGAKSITH